MLDDRAKGVGHTDLLQRFILILGRHGELKYPSNLIHYCCPMCEMVMSIYNAMPSDMHTDERNECNKRQ